MRYSKEHKKQTRERILGAALRKFRSDGYYGVGVDEMVKEAGLTSGAFYGHFGSKSDAFRIISVEGLVQLRTVIESMRDHATNNWVAAFSRWYFSLPKGKKSSSDSSLLPLQGGCALPNLSPEVARSDTKTKNAYQKELLHIVDAIALGMPGRAKNKRANAWALLSLMAGGVILARSVSSKKVAGEITKASLLAINELTKQMEECDS